MTKEQLGILFDWDGVIIDSSVQHERSWERLAAEEKKLLPPGHFVQGFGKKNEWIIPNLLHWASAGDEAGRAGGMRVVGVATTHPATELAGRVDRVVHRLDELAIDDLLRLF